MKTHKMHSDQQKIQNLIEVTSIRFCGQIELFGMVTRLYSFEPKTDGTITIVENKEDETWLAINSFGKCLDNISLVNSDDLTLLFKDSKNWDEVEKQLANYFCCNIYEFHENNNQKLRVEYVVGHDK